MDANEPIPVRYRETWISARWYRDPESKERGFLFQCPNCKRTGFIASPPYVYELADDRRLTVDGVIQCPRRGCSWKGTIENGIASDA